MSLTIDMLPAPYGMPDWQWLDLRVQLMLLEAGYKQAISVHIRSEVPGAQDNLKQLAKLLSSRGLSCQLHTEIIHSNYHLYVGKDSEAVKLLERSLSGELPLAEADLIHGRLSGFPETAIQAFIAGDIIRSEDIPMDMRVRPEYIFGTFQFSKTNWREELAVSREWAKYIKTKAPLLFNQYLDEFTAMRIA